MSGGAPGRRRVAALALEHVRPVDARRPHADEHLALPGLGVGALLHHEAAVLDGHGAHGREI